MGKVKDKLIDLSNLADTYIESWITVDPDDFYTMDPDERFLAVYESLPSFFKKFGEDLAEAEGVNLDQFREFVSDHLKFIAQTISDNYS